LSSNRGERIETKLQLLDEIHANVKSLARQNIKEVLVVLEREDESDPQQRGEFILRDRTSRGNQGANIPSGPTLEPHGQNATPSGNGGADNDVPPLEDQFLNWTNSDASKAAFAGAASHLAEHFRKQRLGIGDGFAFEDQIARASFKLTIEEEQSLLLARTKTWFVVSLNMIVLLLTYKTGKSKLQVVAVLKTLVIWVPYIKIRQKKAANHLRLI